MVSFVSRLSEGNIYVKIYLHPTFAFFFSSAERREPWRSIKMNKDKVPVNCYSSGISSGIANLRRAVYQKKNGCPTLFRAIYFKLPASYLRLKSSSSAERRDLWSSMTMNENKMPANYENSLLLQGL